MLVKSPKRKQKLQVIDETILDNKVAVVCISGTNCTGYAIPIRKVLEYVRSVRDTKPKSVEQLVRWYAEDEALLSNADIVEVIGDQETAERVSEEYMDEANNAESRSTACGLHSDTCV